MVSHPYTTVKEWAVEFRHSTFKDDSRPRRPVTHAKPDMLHGIGLIDRRVTVRFIACTFCILQELLHLSRDMKFPTMWYVRPAKPQISLRIRAN